jgi:hypothetical protein
VHQGRVLTVPDEIESVGSTPSDVIVRNEKGQFAPGTTGRRKSTIHQITRAMVNELGDEIEKLGINGNPLVTLLKISACETLYAGIRVRAASKLAEFLAPRLLAVQLQEPPSVEYEAETKKLKATLKGMFMGGLDVQQIETSD